MHITKGQTRHSNDEKVPGTQLFECALRWATCAQWIKTCVSVGVGSVLVKNESITKEEHCNVRSETWELRLVGLWAG